MRPVEELVGEGREASVYEMQDEIDQRQAILDELPPVLTGFELSDASPSSVDKQRLKIEDEIYRLTLEISWLYFLNPNQRMEKPGVCYEVEESLLLQGTKSPEWEEGFRSGYEEGEKFQRRQQGSMGGKGKAEKIYGVLRQTCINKARDIWDKDPTILIGKVVDELRNAIKDKPYCPRTKTIKDWLKEAEKKKELTIPEEASRPGAPKKDS